MTFQHNDNPLIRKLKALITVRVVFITILLGSFFVFQIEYKSFTNLWAVSNFIAVLYTLTIVYSVFFSKIKDYNRFAYVQIITDILAANALLYLTGGIESWFSFLILLTVMSSSVVLGRRAGYIAATLNSILYGLIIDLQYYRILPISYDSALSEKDFLYNIFVHISAFYLLAFLSGYLSSRLEKADYDLKKLSLFNKELIENIPSGIFSADVKGRILIFNKAAENITGIQRADAFNKKINEIFPFLGILDNANNIEGAIKNIFGENRIISLNVSSLQSLFGEETGFIGIFQDITDMKKMEIDIKNKEKWAAIGELSANIAHEIRNPLASIRGSVEMLKENKITDEQKQKLTEIALKEMERLNNTITDFLKFSSPRPAEFSLSDINVTLGETIELLENTVSMPDNVLIIKNFGGSLWFNADHQKLRQVFWNLAMNAVEAMPEGGELFVSTIKNSDNVEINFEDTGMGIPMKNIKKIFYPFFTTKAGGTGLGLAIAYRIIEEHKGRIDITDNKGHGTIIRVIIPNADGKP
ncbi:MAG: PAS domain S-box protein [Nitrospiraceae bacterium]|nr:PAS domain S-box protein [Nitrospiraceae bacterium]